MTFCVYTKSTTFAQRNDGGGATDEEITRAAGGVYVERAAGRTLCAFSLARACFDWGAVRVPIQELQVPRDARDDGRDESGQELGHVGGGFAEITLCRSVGLFFIPPSRRGVASPLVTMSLRQCKGRRSCWKEETLATGLECGSKMQSRVRSLIDSCRPGHGRSRHFARHVDGFGLCRSRKLCRSLRSREGSRKNGHCVAQGGGRLVG